MTGDYSNIVVSAAAPHSIALSPALSFAHGLHGEVFQIRLGGYVRLPPTFPRAAILIHIEEMRRQRWEPKA